MPPPNYAHTISETSTPNFVTFVTPHKIPPTNTHTHDHQNDHPPPNRRDTLTPHTLAAGHPCYCRRPPLPPVSGQVSRPYPFGGRSIKPAGQHDHAPRPPALCAPPHTPARPHTQRGVCRAAYAGIYILPFSSMCGFCFSLWVVVWCVL